MERGWRSVALGRHQSLYLEDHVDRAETRPLDVRKQELTGGEASRVDAAALHVLLQNRGRIGGVEPREDLADTDRAAHEERRVTALGIEQGRRLTAARPLQ